MAFSAPITHVFELLVPDPNAPAQAETLEIHVYPPINRPRFNPMLLTRLRQFQTEGRSLRDLYIELGRIGQYNELMTMRTLQLSPRSEVNIQVQDIQTPIINTLSHESYETLTKQLYGIPVQLPEFLIINGLRTNFISFPEVPNLQIERFIIDPLLQPWAGPPGTSNRIITLFGRNGLTYLVKARLDPATNQIFPPIQG